MPNWQIPSAMPWINTTPRLKPRPSHRYGSWLLRLGLCGVIAVMEMSGPFWPFYLRQSGMTDERALLLWSAVLTAAPMLSAALTATTWGRMGDRFGHKGMLLRAVLGLALTQWLVGLVDSAWLLLMLRLLQGALGGVIAAAMAYGLQLERSEPYEGDDLSGRVLGGLHSAIAAGTLIGPLLGGFIAQYLGFGPLFLGSALFCLTLSLCWWLGLRPVGPCTIPTNKMASPCDESRSGRDSVVKPSAAKSSTAKPAAMPRAAVPALLMLVLAAQLARMMTQPFLTLFAEQSLGMELRFLGALYGATGLAMLLAAPLWGRRFDRQGASGLLRQTALLALLCAAIMLLHLEVTSAAGLFLLRFVWGLCLAAILPSMLCLLARESVSVGVSLGRGQAMSKWGNFIGYLSGGALVAGFGLASGFVAVALIYLGLALGCYWLARHIRAVNRAEPPNDIECAGPETARAKE
jgi:MFS transporter, DHA1 family, staphyloferrin B biosynthesis exporter